MSIHPIAIAQLAMLLFFAILFLQSGIDKVVDRKGNLAWMEPHFEKSPFKNAVKPLLSILTLFEIASGLACAAGAGAIGFFASRPMPESSRLMRIFQEAGEIYAYTQAKEFVLLAASLVLFTFLQLFMGQRLAKDYAGAAAIAPYFAIGILLLLSVHFSLPAELASRLFDRG